METKAPKQKDVIAKKQDAQKNIVIAFDQAANVMNYANAKIALIVDFK